MKKIALLLVFVFVVVVIGTVPEIVFGANIKEKDFSPFPLSLKSELLLSGHWDSESGYLEIIEVKHHSINEHSWFLIYEIEPKEPKEPKEPEEPEEPNKLENKEVSGFIFFDAEDEAYKQVFWMGEGFEVKPFVLYRLKDREQHSVVGEHCVYVNSTYMLKMNEKMFVRSECGG